LTQIYLIRHAEAEGNIYRRYQGHYDSLITERGKRQIAALARRFDGVRIDAVYSSDLYRAYKTSEAVRLPRGLPAVTDGRLREISLGGWEDTPFGEIAALDPGMAYNLDNDPWRWSAPGAETYAAARSRMLEVMREIAERRAGENVAVFSHGLAMTAFLCAVLKIRDAEALSGLRGHMNTAVSVFEYDSGAFKLRTYSDYSHLTEDLKQRKPGLHARFAETSPGEYDVTADGVKCGELSLDLDSGASGGAGMISRLALYEGFRGKGLGVQLLGQAVSVYRGLGRNRLRLVPDGVSDGFFEKLGFVRSGGALEMDIGRRGDA
jgi:probable phosphoglycerate mutase